MRTHPGLMPSHPCGDGLLEGVRAFEVDAEQAVAVGPGAAAPATRLDAEQVVEQRHHEVVVEVATGPQRTTNETIDSRSASRLPSISRSGSSRHASMARAMKASSRARMTSAPTADLSWKTSPARIAPMMSGVPPSSRCSTSSR
jgi:hypothetical protein